MELQTLQGIALFTGLSFMVAQFFVKEKQISHLLFAVFCGSVTMSVAKDMSGGSIGAYKYLIGMAACATCNCYWLLSRSLFRGDKGIAVHHLLLAAVVALLILFNQGYSFASQSALVTVTENNLFQYGIRELTILLSSCILVLSFWEGCRGFSAASKQEKNQRLLFLVTFGGAVLIVKATQGIFIDNPNAQEIAKTMIILFVLINTQILLFWRYQGSPNAAAETAKQIAVKEKTQSTESSEAASTTAAPVADETLLSMKVKELIVDNSLFLQPNLKIADVAQKLNVPEYRVSNALRHHLHARNFNQFVNELRIKHAKSLLTDLDKKKWPVLVVGLESGFASVGPFTRAFKATTGYTPNQYRQKYTQLESA